MTRRRFLQALPFLPVLISCRAAPPEPIQQPSFPEKKPSPTPETCVLLPKGETRTFGRLTILNQSEIFKLCLIPERLSQEKAAGAGLTTASYQLALYLLDEKDAARVLSPEEMAVTLADPERKEPISIIALERFLKKAKKEREKTPLENDKFCHYLSVLISQAALVEIYNQAHSYKVKPFDEPAIEALDKKANEFGQKYRDEMLSGEAKPFVIVLGITDSLQKFAISRPMYRRVNPPRSRIG